MNTSFSIDPNDKLGLECLEIVKNEARTHSLSFSNVVRNLLVAEAKPELVNNKPKQIKPITTQIKDKPKPTVKKV